ncbi:MAG: nucleoside-diphosphate sugar epimerase/dehydratase [Sphingopyxis sp.]
MFHRLVHISQSGIFGFIHRLSSLPRSVRQAVILTLDLTSCFFTVILAYWLRTGEWVLPNGPLARFFLLSALIWIIVSVIFGTYRSIVRYSGARTLVSLGIASVIQSVLLSSILLLLTIPGVPRTMAVIQPLVMMMAIASIRLFGRFALVDMQRHRSIKGATRRILIYGAGLAGQQIAAALDTQSDVKLIGFADDDLRLRGQKLDGKPVYSAKSFADLVDKLSITEVILAMPSASKTRRYSIVADLAPLSVRVTTLPELPELAGGRISLSDLHDIDVVDLLGRDPVTPDRGLLEATVRGRTVLITGAGGSIGSELAQQVLRVGPKRIILLEMTEFALFSIEQAALTLSRHGTLKEHQVEIFPELANCTDTDSVERIFNRYKPDTVFHAAAYKHVPLVEQNPVSGVGNNVFAALNIAAAAEKHGARHCILISSDKAVRPTSLMGASKRVCEMILQAFHARGSKTIFAMVRFGNVLGSSGSVVPLFRRQIANGGPVTITDRAITRYFMTIPEAAQLVVQASGMAEGGDVFLLDMGDPVRIVELAESMIRLSGYTVQSVKNPDGDIAIIEVGLRPGEKLFEELLIDDKSFATGHPSIFRANERVVPWDELSQAIERLRLATSKGDGVSVRQIMVELVPEFGMAPPIAPVLPMSPIQASRHAQFAAIDMKYK